jgi:hypothetical protein
MHLKPADASMKLPKVALTLSSAVENSVGIPIA